MQRIKSRFGGFFAVAAVAAVGIAALVEVPSAVAGPKAHASTTSAQLKAAEAAIAPFETTPTSIGRSEPLAKPVKGKVFDVLDDGTPFVAQLVIGVQQAVAALGDKVRVITQQGDTPQAVQAAWNQIVANPPAVVLSEGDPTALYHTQLEALHAKHVPVVAFFTNEDPLLAANIYGPPQYRELGRLQADYIIAKSHGKANVLVLALPQIAGLQGSVNSLLATLKSSCSGCQEGYVDTQLSDIGKNDPGTAVSYLQKNPGINWIEFADPDEQIGVPEALAGAGVKGISEMTGAGGKVNYSYIKAGLSTVDASQPPTFSAWALVDAAARALDHQKIPVHFFPMEFLTKAQLTFNINNEWPDVPNFEKKFEALWRAKK